jgi:hypothetical protein
MTNDNRADLIDALMEALPYVEDGADDPVLSTSGRAKAKALAQRIRKLVND